MDSWYDKYYSIIDGVFLEVAEGTFGAEDNSQVEFDENGMPIYHYYWNGEEVSEEEYTSIKNTFFDSEQALSGVSYLNETKVYNKFEILDFLQNY